MKKYKCNKCGKDIQYDLKEKKGNRFQVVEVVNEKFNRKDFCSLECLLNFYKES